MDNPNGWLILCGIMVAIFGNLALFAWTGHRASKAIKRIPRTTLLRRVFNHYITWSLLGGLFFCACPGAVFVAGDAGAPFAVFFIGPLLFCLMIAQELEPAHKVCKTCKQ